MRTLINLKQLFIMVCTLSLLIACNKDGNITQTTPEPPTIDMGNHTGIYTVKIGDQITITPTYKNANEASYTWKIGQTVVGTSPSYTFKAEELKEVYILLRVESKDGHAEREFRIDVVDKMPPVISIATPTEGYLTAYTGKELEVVPTIKNSDKATYSWALEGSEVSSDSVYIFLETNLGTYNLTLTVSNQDGTDKAELKVEVKPLPEVSIVFEPQNLSVPLGRTLIVAPVINYSTPETTYQWKIDQQTVSGATSNTLQFKPLAEREYAVSLTATTATSEVIQTATVVCTSSEGTFFRPATASSQPFCNKVFEFRPAPGQFINEGYSVSSMEEACGYAIERLNKKEYVSLGAFGGYIVVGFDHSISNKPNDYDFAIAGNSFDGSSEPGIVWVMQDENGDGQPNDTWYELAGSESTEFSTRKNYSVTYFKPKTTGMAVQWRDSDGKTGSVDYNGTFHNQGYYYPQWITEGQYTLSGTSITSNISEEDGIWSFGKLDWGYADNAGTDRLGTPTSDGDPSENRFDIHNAINPLGDKVELQYIDFIKVQTAIVAKAPRIGELSSDVCSFREIK